MAEEHFRYRRWAEGPREGELALGTEVALVVDAPPTALMTQAVADFATFCERCMQFKLGESAAGGQAIRLRLTGSLPEPYDVLDPAGETFTLEISPAGVLLEARHERGLLHGTHYLERLMADRGGPYLQPGRRQMAPQFMPRMTAGMGMQPENMDAYLSLLSHFGANGVHRGVNLHTYTRSSLLPALNSPGYEENIQRLRAWTEQLLRHGLDAYFVLHSAPLAADHSVFLDDPTRRGAPYKVSQDMAPQNVLCSSNETVLAYYEETVENLFREIPGAAGAVIIVGGEGFMHCYSRPYGDFEGHSSCRQCRDKAPAGEVVRLANRLAAAVKRAGQEKVLFAWPYSAFTWSGEADPGQLEWIAGLSEEVLVLSNFDTGSVDKQNRAGVVLYDYNIKSVGPSEVFQAQADQLQTAGRPVFAKTESNTTTVVNCLPYVPVHFRWHRRFQEMQALGVAGYMNQWHFYGPNGSLPEELQYHAVWSPAAETEELLARAAERDFGVTGETTEQVVEAWREMSEAWDDFPYSAMTAGEREFYFRGPLHYGPAQPLIFNEQDDYRLPSAFFGLRGDLVSVLLPEEREEAWRHPKPRYVSNLLLTLPYGTERYLELVSRCRTRWAHGVTRLQEALGPEPPERAQMELDICTLIEIHLTTAENVVRFYAARERLWREPLDVQGFRGVVAELSAILREEIANAERSLPVLEREFRVRPYNREMVEEKLRQCRLVVEEELPMFDSSVRFHVWYGFP